MTPTLWAAFEGHVDALRLLVARGGDPDKTDYFGNTGLHLSAARGHEFCVKFLIKFGCNIWALDIDRHSARELATINGRENILKFLDIAQTEQEAMNRKKSKLMREKAEKDAEKRLKEYVKRQKMADVKAEKEQKRLLKDRVKADIETICEHYALPHKPNVLTFKGRVKPSQTFSDIVGTISINATNRRQGNSAVGRKVQARKALDDFRVVEIENDGKKSVRSLTGLRRDSEVMYVGTYDNQAQQMGKRGRISDVWGTLSKAQSTPDLLGDRNYCEEEEEDVKGVSKDVVEEAVLFQEPASIFNRPGFGSVAFRRSITATLDTLSIPHIELKTKLQAKGAEPLINGRRGSVSGHHNEEISIGSAGSLARRQSMWDDDRLSAGDETDETDEEWSPLQRFLVAHNLMSIQSSLEAEQIDLEALMLLTDADMAALKLPLGPKRKLTNAISTRKTALGASKNIMKDSRL
ncbi:Usher syndrome type-1G protein homolog isoform X2 [Fopius arisanus]|nr:PREDICTED: Usher syndrome type-1G protein homolog isoform X2 [Fopius arisanus]